MDMDRTIARLITTGTLLGVTALSIGVLGMIRLGISPTELSVPSLDIAALPAGLWALQPVAFLWLGLIIVIATPVVRVAAALVAFARTGHPRMVLISAGILVVIAAGVVLGVGGAG
jgi:uncharacterized membrane protein